MQDSLAINKGIVVRFNNEVIQRGNMQAFEELVAEDFINHTARFGTSTGPDGMARFYNSVLRTAFHDLMVEIHDQVAEGDKVATRKTILGNHRGLFIGLPPTGKRVAVRITEIVRLRDGQYIEHWNSMDMQGLMKQIMPD